LSKASCLPGAPPKIPRSDINIYDWIRAPKGVTAHEQRQYILKNPTNAAERALRLSRRQGEQAKTGKRIEKLVGERRPSKSEAGLGLRVQTAGNSGQKTRI
jgi:hypothetical protein